MHRWILKAIAQKGISFLPFSQNLNFFCQKYITRGIELSDEYFEARLLHCVRHYQYFRKYSSVKNFSHLELGTGWYPIVPTGMFLYGADSITTVDIHRFSNENYTKKVLRKFLEYHQKGVLEKFLPAHSKERLKIILQEAEHPSPDYYTLLEKHNITYMVMDVRKLPVPDKSFDLITSNNTFEHIAPQALEGILRKLSVLCKEGGVMSHAIDMSDHFAHFDKNIPIYNFLKFSDAQWKLIDNKIQSQNRLRIYDYRKIYHKLSIPLTEEINEEFNLEEYNRVKANKKFLPHPPEENAVSYSLLVSII